MGGKSDGGSGDATVRYAGYIEDKHKTFLEVSEAAGIVARGTNVYTSYVDIDFDDAFYGAGYTMASFPSLYDMYGKFMAGLDIETLFNQVLYDVQNAETIQNASIAHRDLLDDDIEQVVLPRFKAGMRDINSVMASSFLVGSSVIEQGRVKKLAEFDANLRYKLIPVAVNVLAEHLSWNKSMIATYIDVMKTAIAAKIDQNDKNYAYAHKEAMWPFTVLEQERANIGALQGATTASAGEVSQTQSTIGGLAGGAALGASVTGGNPIGAAIGGVLGGIASFF